MCLKSRSISLKHTLELGKDWKENSSKWDFQQRTHGTDSGVSDLRIPHSRQGWLCLAWWISFWGLGTVLACLYLGKSASYQCSWCAQWFCPVCNCWSMHLAKHPSCCFELISQHWFSYSVTPSLYILPEKSHFTMHYIRYWLPSRISLWVILAQYLIK